jgi:hypothetical protein
MAHGSWLMAHGSWLMAHGSKYDNRILPDRKEIYFTPPACNLFCFPYVLLPKQPFLPEERMWEFP